MNDQPYQPLDTPRLRLRCIEESDAHAVSKLITPEVSRWVASWPTPYTHEMALARIQRARRQNFEKLGISFAMVEKASGELIGWSGVGKYPENPRLGSFGYWIGEHYQGRGYMKESAPLMVRAAFDWLDVDVIEAGAQLKNERSFKVMLACGMKKTREAMFFSSARHISELCAFYEVAREAYSAI